MSGYHVSTRRFDAAGSAIVGGLPTIAVVGRDPRLAYKPGEREFGVLLSRDDESNSYVTVARVPENGGVVPVEDLAPGSTDGAGFDFDSHEHSYLASWAGGGGFLAADLTPIAPADFAAGAVVTYNAASDEYLLVRPTCVQPGGLSTVGGRRVGNPVAADRTGPALQLTAQGLQRVVKQRGLVVRARCGEACAVRAAAQIAMPDASRSVALRLATRTLSANARARLKLKTSKVSIRKLRRALKKGKRLGARLTVTAIDRTGNRTIATRQIRARR